MRNPRPHTGTCLVIRPEWTVSRKILADSLYSRLAKGLERVLPKCVRKTMHVHICMHTSIKNIYIYIHIHAFTYTFLLHIHKHIHIHIHIYIYTYILHTYTWYTIRARVHMVNKRAGLSSETAGSLQTAHFFCTYSSECICVAECLTEMRL